MNLRRKHFLLFSFLLVHLLFLVSAYAVLPQSTPLTPWISTKQYGDIVYFLHANPASIERYDLVSQQFLTSDSIGTRQAKSGTTYVSQPLVVLDDAGGAFTSKSFQLNKTLKNEMLAIVLAAMSNGFQIMIYADPSSTTNPPIIYEMHVLSIP